MTAPLMRSVTCAHPGGLHRMVYREWPASGQELSTVVCVHGLTRNSGDFDPLAAELANDGYRVICPDIVGRGLSDHLADPALYAIPQYVSDCVTLFARLDRESLDWVGTSMGGLIGMSLAAMPGQPIARLMLNDIGPVVALEGLTRIGSEIAVAQHYANFEAAEARLRARMTTFGPHTDDEFRILSRNYFTEVDGKWVARHDPSIANAFSEPFLADIDLWPLYELIDCPVGVIRGAESDLLRPETAALMTQGGPRGTGPEASLATLPGVGHAPTLIRDEQREHVGRFLRE